MTQKGLDDPDVDAFLKQVGREGVAHVVGPDVLLDAGFFTRQLDDLSHRIRGEGLIQVAVLEEPRLGARDLPILPEDCEQYGESIV